MVQVGWFQGFSWWNTLPSWSIFQISKISLKLLTLDRFHPQRKSYPTLINWRFIIVYGSMIFLRSSIIGRFGSSLARLRTGKWRSFL